MYELKSSQLAFHICIFGTCILIIISCVILSPYSRFSKGKHYRILARSRIHLKTNSSSNNNLTDDDVAEMEESALLDKIRCDYLVPPSSAPYKLARSRAWDYAQYPGTTGRLLKIFPPHKNETRFFIEVGAHDGETISNTLSLEKNFKWTGLLIEPHPESFKQLLSKNRKSWLMNACLSGSIRPQNLTLEMNKNIPTHSRLTSVVSKQNAKWSPHVTIRKTILCFPIYSILVALNVTTVDFFSLDVEGAEELILKTIPFDRIDINVFLIEQWPHKSHQPLINYMKRQGYVQQYFLRSTNQDFLFVHRRILTSSNMNPVLSLTSQGQKRTRI